MKDLDALLFLHPELPKESIQSSNLCRIFRLRGVHQMFEGVVFSRVGTKVYYWAKPRLRVMAGVDEKFEHTLFS